MISGILKDVIIPLLSPLIAVLTLILFVWHERKKLELKSKEEVNQIAKSIYRDLLYLRDQWELFGAEIRLTEKPERKEERIELLRNIFERIRKNIFEKPEIWEIYFSDIKTKVKDNKIFLLLGEMEIDFARKNLQFNDFILYAIYKLLSLWEPDKNKKVELDNIINMIETESEDQRVIDLKGAF